MTARAGFKTKLKRVQLDTGGAATVPPARIFKIVHYTSPAGKLAAYLTPDPGDGKKHPAIVWAHGGFGGIDSWLWTKKDKQDPGAFREAGIVVMCPAWRGENDNPGQYEMFYGEVEDAVAAIDYVSKLPYVDPTRVYMAGHSTGGTITLLTVESTNKLRAAFSFGGMPDITALMQDTQGQGYDNTPFDWQNPQECHLRSAIDFATAIRTPTFYFEGSKSPLAEYGIKMVARGQAGGAPLTEYIPGDADHFSILQPMTALIARKILQDTGSKCNITVESAEVIRAFYDYERRKQ